MRALSYFSMISIAMLSQVLVLAQTDSVKNSVQFKLGVYFNSGLNYYGRTDSLRSSGFFPVAELWFTKSIYVNAAPVFVNNEQVRFQYAGTILTAGYRLDKKKWGGNFYVAKPVYRNNSQLVQSALKAQVSGALTYRNKIINITGGGDIKFSDKTDYGMTAGLDHIFRVSLPNDFILVMNPSAYVNAGTRQFTNTYYKRNSFLFLPGVEEELSENISEFSLLSYEISMPVILVKGKFQVLLIPAYVIPQNLLTGNNAEYGNNMLYITAGVKVSL